MSFISQNMSKMTIASGTTGTVDLSDASFCSKKPARPGAITPRVRRSKLLTHLPESRYAGCITIANQMRPVVVAIFSPTI